MAEPLHSHTCPACGHEWAHKLRRCGLPPDYGCLGCLREWYCRRFLAQLRAAAGGSSAEGTPPPASLDERPEPERYTIFTREEVEEARKEAEAAAERIRRKLGRMHVGLDAKIMADVEKLSDTALSAATAPLWSQLNSKKLSPIQREEIRLQLIPLYEEMVRRGLEPLDSDRRGRLNILVTYEEYLAAVQRLRERLVSRQLSYTERSVMRAFGLKTVQELDELFSKPPDEAYLADVQRAMDERFEMEKAGIRDPGDSYWDEIEESLETEENETVLGGVVSFRARLADEDLSDYSRGCQLIELQIYEEEMARRDLTEALQPALSTLSDGQLAECLKQVRLQAVDPDALPSIREIRQKEAQVYERELLRRGLKDPSGPDLQQ